jgi:DNA modification methylase
VDAYRRFLEAKVATSATLGVAVDPGAVNPILKPHQRDIVRWMVQGGRRACFAAFGLGKTLIQLEAVRLTLEHAGGRGLIVLPLGVRQEFTRDAAMLGIPVRFIRTVEEADETGIYLTNYETVRDGKLDPRRFTVASLDEASVLRGFGGTKTFREFMRLFAGQAGPRAAISGGVPYRFVATATPSPNEYIELLAYAAYLDVMDVSAAKTRFFKRDSVKADNLTLHPHKAREFWLWVSSWAIFVQRPSDLGYDDAGYSLPPLDVRWHEVPTDHSNAGQERDGQARMFRNSALGVVAASREKRDSLGTRVAALMEIIRNADAEGVFPRVLPEEPGSNQGEGARVLRGEQGSRQEEDCGMACREPGADAGASEAPRRRQPRQGHQAERGVVSREQAARGGDEPAEQAAPVRPDSGAVRGDAPRAVGDVCNLQASTDGAEGGPLPRDGEGPRTPLQGLQLRPGDVPRQHDDSRASHRVPDQLIVWCDLNDEQRAIESALDDSGISYSSLDGSQGIDEREPLLEEWRARRTRVFLSKPMMYGAGVNLQQAHLMIFAGIGFKAQDVLQAVHRIHRFLQTQPCTVHFIYTEAEREIRRVLEQKWSAHNVMVEKMAALIREHGLAHSDLHRALTREMEVHRFETSGPGYRLINGDSIEESRSLDSDSVGLIVTSIPFSTQYEYSPSYRDLGHTDNDAHFFEHLGFLTPQLLRVLQPGRVAAVHVKDRIVPGGLAGLGFQTVSPFSDYTIAHFKQHGFAFLGRKTIVTDVVRENNQTYRLGWTEQCKDGSRMGAGMPEYVLLFRKPPTDSSDGYADVPVVKSKEKYSRSRWQIDAHGFMRSSGNRPLSPEDLGGLTHAEIFRLFRRHSLALPYDFEEHVALGEHLERKGILPVTFMLLQPQSWHPDVWTDVARMRTLNMLQERKGQEQHLCPMQFDIAERLIAQLSNPGDLVLDPFGGLMTVPERAIRLGRRGLGIELSARYFADGAAYCAAASREVSMPTLFDVVEQEENDAA